MNRRKVAGCKRFWKMDETKRRDGIECHGSKQKLNSESSDYLRFRGAINISVSFILTFHF